MRKFNLLMIGVLFIGLAGLSSCKKERSCTCTLTYFNSPDQTRIVPVGKTTMKQGQEACNNETKTIIATETPNGINGATCEIK